MWVWDCSVLVCRGRGVDPIVRERPGPSPAAMAIYLFLLSDEVN